MSYIDPEVGRRLKALRTRAGFSRERLASFAGLSPSLIKMVEHGKRALTLRAAQRLAPHLGVHDLADLFGPAFRFSLEGRPSHPTVPEVRRALTVWQLRVEGPPPTPEFVPRRCMLPGAPGTPARSNAPRPAGCCRP